MSRRAEHRDILHDSVEFSLCVGRAVRTTTGVVTACGGETLGFDPRTDPAPTPERTERLTALDPFLEDRDIPAERTAAEIRPPEIVGLGLALRDAEEGLDRPARVVGESVEAQ